MRGYRILFLLMLALLIIGNSYYAQYWFQFGARGSSSSSQNNGASIMIKTIDQSINSGSLGFWVGENLQNNAFLQIGYLVQNYTAEYPSFCDNSGCRNNEVLHAGDAEWFYEYFYPNTTSAFLGGIGPDGSAGNNGTFHNYSFFEDGGMWYFKVDGKIVGNVSLGSSTSGSNSPVAFGELANTSINTQEIHDVAFMNFSIYKNGKWLPVPSATSYIGYGDNSDTSLPDPYGVTEFGNRANYFVVGSGLLLPADFTTLWSSTYYLGINSTYGYTTSRNQYIPYTEVNISEPNVTYIGADTREVFSGWIGSGFGSYTGPKNNVTLIIYGNITENANWNREYFVNIETPYGKAQGSGWYKNNSVASYGINSNIIYINRTTRIIFAGWSNGNKGQTGKLTVDGHENITALWIKEFYVNASSGYQFANVSGSGWYANGSVARVYVTPNVSYSDPSERYAFIGWNNGGRTRNISINVTSPLSIYPVFQRQYEVYLDGRDAYGRNIDAYFRIENKTANRIFLAAGRYNLNLAVYKDANIPIDYMFNVSAPSIMPINLSVYNVTISTTDFFSLPVNALVNAIFANGSSSSFYTGENGIVTLVDVPLGSVSTHISYLGISKSADAYGGSVIKESFISLYNIEFGIAVIIILIIVVYIIIKEEEHLKRNIVV